MKRILIHIGYPKTGTSWLQKNIFSKVSNYHLVNNSFVIKNIIEQDALDFDAKKIRALFEERYGEGENLIISVEGLIGTTHGLGLRGFYTKEIAYRLQKVFPEAEILIGIRNQLTMIPSTYLQYVRGGGTYGLNRYLYHFNFQNMPASLILFTFKYFEYDKLLSLYFSLFSSKQIQVYLFECFKEDVLVFARKLIEYYDFDIDISKINTKVVLPRLRVGLVPIVRFLNLFTSKKMLNKYYLIDILNFNVYQEKIIKFIGNWVIFGPHVNYKNILGKNNYLFISEYYRKSNQRLLNDYNLNVKKYNYPI
jgi:hypothetical protein